MASLALTNAELYAELGRLLGISRSSSDWDTVTAADVDRIIRAGRRRFFSASDWKFLYDNNTIPLAAPITTGTVTIVSGAVTLVGSTFPAAADIGNYMFSPQGGGAYGIATWTDATNIILDDTTVNADALSTYNLYQYKYDLPSAFGGWAGPISVDNYDGVYLNESRNLPEYVLRSFANRQNVRTNRPELFSVISTPDSETAIATHQLQIWPFANQLYILRGRYKLVAGDTLDGLEADISADPIFTECYKEAVLSAAEVIAFGQPGAHRMRFQELLVEAKRKDNAMSGVRYGRPRRSVRGRSRYHDLIVGTVDLSGQEP